MNRFHRWAAASLAAGVMCAVSLGAQSARRSDFDRDAFSSRATGPAAASSGTLFDLPVMSPEPGTAGTPVEVTAIKRVVNNSGFTVILANTENPDKFLNGGTANPNSTLTVDMWIPWATRSTEFLRHHITVTVQNGSTIVRRFVIWQRAHVDGDFVRVGETDPADPAALGYAEPGTRISGVSVTGGDRRLTVAANGSISLGAP